MSNLPLLPSLLLAVLGLPLLAALIVSRTSRCTASFLAAGHLILTAVFVAFATGTIDDTAIAETRTAFTTFEPRAVPGDPGTANGEPLNITNWTLLPLAANSQSLSGTAIQFFVGVDGLNLWLVALTSLMTFLAVLVSPRDAGRGYYVWLFLLQAACLGAFLSFDLLLFYVFFELTLIPTFFLIGRYGVGSGRRDAARKFFLYTLFGSLFTLVGILGVAITNPEPLDAFDKPATLESAKAAMPKAGAVTFSIPALMHNVTVWDEAHHAAAARAKKTGGTATTVAIQAESDRRSLGMWLFIAIMAGFAVKVPIVPFHTWLPGAYGEAPLAVTMLLSAVMAKLGTFGILRIAIPLVPEAAVEYGLGVFGTLAAIGIVYAAFCAYAQKDLKLLAAYSSVSHLGLLVLGLFALTPESLTGATLHMVNHGLTAGALFALLAFLFDRYRSLDVTHFGGLWTTYPVYTFFFILLSLAAVGLPGLNSFVSEMLMLAGLFDPRNLSSAGFGLAAAAAAGVFLSAWYTFTMVKRVFFGPVKAPEIAPAPITSHELATFSLLAALCLILGLYPQPVIDTLAPDVKRIANCTDAARSRLNSNHRAPSHEQAPPLKKSTH